MSTTCPRCACSSVLHDGDRYVCILCAWSQEIRQRTPEAFLFELDEDRGRRDGKAKVA